MHTVMLNPADSYMNVGLDGRVMSYYTGSNIATFKIKSSLSVHQIKHYETHIHQFHTCVCLFLIYEHIATSLLHVATAVLFYPEVKIHLLKVTVDQKQHIT